MDEEASEQLEQEEKDTDSQPVSMPVIPLEVLRYFGVYSTHDLSSNEERQLNSVVRYFSEQGLDVPDILENIGTLEQKIKKPNTGVSRIMHLYNYIRLSKEVQDLEKMRAAYEENFE